MELKVINAQGQISGSLQASDALFAREYNEALVHQLVTAFLANARSGNRAQLTRAEVTQNLVEGFFPVVEATARPASRARAALSCCSGMMRQS